jgi:hypothetical protein
MVRGGRSCPSDRKLGGGADKSGNTPTERVGGAKTDGNPPTNGVTEQKAEQTLHGSCGPGGTSRSEAAEPCSCAGCSWTLRTGEPSWKPAADPCTARSSPCVPTPAGGHSIVAARAALIGSRAARNTSSQERDDFTCSG